MVFELVHRQVFGRSPDRRIAPGIEKARNLEQARNVLLVVPAIELGLEFRVDVAPYHQQSGSACLRHRYLLDAANCEPQSITNCPIDAGLARAAQEKRKRPGVTDPLR